MHMLLYSMIMKFVERVLKDLLSKFLSAFLNWLKQVPDMLKGQIKGKLWGAKAFINIADGREFSDNYSLDSAKQWHKTTLSRMVDINSIPEEIKRRALNSSKVEITDDLEQELELASAN